MSLLDIAIGTATKELAKAREEALTHGIKMGYHNFHWRLYSDDPMKIELWGVLYRHEEAVQLAIIKTIADYRAHHDLNLEVKTLWL